MAIYHAHVSSGSRSGGQSGAAKVAYVLRQGRYAGRYDLVVAGHGNLPQWADGDPCTLFAAADLYERKNGRLFVEIEVALPHELEESQQYALVQAIAAAVTAPGMPFTYAIHAGRPKPKGGPANPHAHILISERVNDGIPRSPSLWFKRANHKNPRSGGAAKNRDMKDASWVEDTRKVIEGLINTHLERARVAARVTSDSHATRIRRALAEGDIETALFLFRHPPGIHLGPTVAALERDQFTQKEGEEPRLRRAGEPTERGDQHRAVAADTEALRFVAELSADSAALDLARTELRQAEEAVAAARSAGLADDEVLRIYERSETADAGAGWGSVRAAAAARVARQAAAETAAGAFPIDVEALCQSARGRGADPVSVLEEATAAFAAARTTLLADAEVWRKHDAAELSERGTGWMAVKAAAASRQAQKEAAEAGAATVGLDIEGVYAGAQAEGADPVVALEEKVGEERLASERRAAVEQREGSVTATEQGRTWLLAAQRDALDSSGRQLTLEQREKIVETVYQRLDEALGDREAALRSIPETSQYLPEVVGVAERLLTLAERESMVMTAEQRLGEELADREERLVKSAGSGELLVEAFCELCELDTSFGDGSSLPERWRIITQAEEWHEGDRAEDAERSVALDDLEAMLRETSSGAQHLAAAQQEVLGEVEEPATLAERDSVVMTAWRRVEQELDGREQALAERCCEDGSVEVGGAWLYAIKLTELEAGQQQNAGPSPGCREQALAWAGQQMDRLDALRQKEALDLFFGKLVELEPARGPADIAEERRAAAARRQDLDALSKDELVFVEEKRDALDPHGREAGPWKPAHVDAAGDYAHARVEALDEKIERLRTIIEKTPGDGYARLLAAGFGEASRQQKLEALTVMETDLAEDFERREERIRAVVEGEEFLRHSRLLVLDADREPATVAERGRVIDQADRLWQEAKREAEAKRQAEQERETRQWEEQRAAAVQALKRLSGGMDLYQAHLADLDPKWDLKRNDKSSRENIDAALVAARSDAARLERLRVVLSNEVDTARYREELGKVAGQFKTSDLDRAFAVAGQEREERETRQWEEQRAAAVQALKRLSGGMDLYHAHLADLDPKWDLKRNDKSSRENIDAALVAARSDAARFERLRVVLSNEVDTARYREELGKVAGQFKTSDLDRALAVAEQDREERETRQREEQKAARVRRHALHQMVSDTPGGDECLRAAGWEKARTDGMQDRVLATVELSLTADFHRREQQLRTDDEGEAFLRRGRVEVLEADRAPETLADRGRVIDRAEALRQAALGKRKQQAAGRRVARLKRLFAASGGDTAFFAALDARKPSWERGTAPADIDHALDLAEQRVDRTKPATAEHAVIVDAEQTFQSASSEDWRQAGDRFPKGSLHARMSQQLADRTRASALAAEREEPPSSPALVQRLFTWLRAQVDKLLERLGLVKPVTRQPPPQPAEPPPPQVVTGHRGDAEEARWKAVSDRESAICIVPGGEECLLAEESKIRGGSSRPLSLSERESVASTVEAWIRTGVRADVERVIGETHAAVGFAPPVQIWRAVGHQLHQEREYIQGSRPGLLISTLRTLPDGTADVPTDEEQTLQAALDEQRRAEVEKRHQKTLEVYRRDLQIWKGSGSLLRPRGWPKPKKPPKPEPAPLTQEQVKKFRLELINEMKRFVRGRIEQMFELLERARPMRPGERTSAPSPARVPPQRQPGRGYDWSH